MEINEPLKNYYEPSHSTEHILNQTMIRMFGCPRSNNAHIERRKSKCDYELAQTPSQEQITEIENRVNEVISQHLPVWEEFMDREEAAKIVDLSKLPERATEQLRIIHVGDYDACPCIGQHVKNTSEIGRFEILTNSFENGRWRVRWHIVETNGRLSQ